MATTSIPARHPRSPRPVPASVRLFAALLRVRPANAQEFRRLGENLTVGDEPMDRLVEWMCSAGVPQARAQFEQALADGIDSVPDAPAPLREFFTQVERVPDWVDWDLIRTGAQVMRSGGADGMYVARDVALQGGYMFSGFNQTLLRTGALEKGSNQRFAETMQWALDVLADDGLLPGGVGYRSTLRVRMIHSFVRRHVAAMPDWRGEEWGLPVNQTDMAATIHGSLLVPVVAAMGLGILITPANAAAVAHLTRYVGWLMGVRDEFLPNDFRDGVRILHHALSALASPDETSKQLAMPMAEDPLSWNYRRFARLRRRIARSQHLSIISAALGPGAMRSLGLPPHVLPWYPVLRFPINAVRSVLALLPGGLERAAVRGDREQAVFKRTVIAGNAQIGESVGQIARAR